MKDENGVPIKLEVPVYYAIDDDKKVLIDRDEMVDEFLGMVDELEREYNTMTD